MLFGEAIRFLTTKEYSHRRALRLAYENADFLRAVLGFLFARKPFKRIDRVIDGRRIRHSQYRDLLAGAASREFNHARAK